MRPCQILQEHDITPKNRRKYRKDKIDKVKMNNMLLKDQDYNGFKWKQFNDSKSNKQTDNSINSRRGQKRVVTTEIANQREPKLGNRNNYVYTFPKLYFLGFNKTSPM